MGAPDDEYDFEAADLVRFVLGTQAPTPESVQAVWNRSFSREMRSEMATSISIELEGLRAAVPNPQGAAHA